METVGVFLQTRELIQQVLAHLATEAMLAIPTGFVNNIAWNVGHIIAVQQSLLYRLSSVPMHITKEHINLYKPGTSPTDWAQQPDCNALKQLLAVTTVQFADDYQKEVFQKYQPYTTSTGISLQTTADAFTFNNFHEGLHLGTIISIIDFL